MHTPARAWVRFAPKPEAKLRLFCLHYAGGAASAFRSWATGLSGDIDLFAAQLPGREGRFAEPPHPSIDALVAELADAAEPWLDRPYMVFGHSLGAIVGFEWIRAVEERGWRLPDLFIPSGHHAPHMPHRNPPYFGASDEEVLARLRSYQGTPEEVLRDDALMKALLPRLRADFRLIATYAYREGLPLEVPIWAFDGRDDENVDMEELMAWNEQSAFQFRCTRFPGGHFFIKECEPAILEVINNEANDILRYVRASARAVQARGA
jgi:medium-chain acyl-[acyl-carrier-protein] hydrolase